MILPFAANAGGFPANAFAFKVQAGKQADRGGVLLHHIGFDAVEAQFAEHKVNAKRQRFFGVAIMPMPPVKFVS